MFRFALELNRRVENLFNRLIKTMEKFSNLSENSRAIDSFWKIFGKFKGLYLRTS